MDKTTVIQAKENGDYVLSIDRASISQVVFADIDLLIMTTDGRNFVLPGAALAAMEPSPPSIVFSDGVTTAAQIFAMIQSVEDPMLNTHIMEGEAPKEQKKDLEETLREAQEKLEQQEKDLAAAQAKLEEQEQVSEKTQAQEKELSEVKEQVAAQDQDKNQALADIKAKEAAEEMAEKLQKIADQLHTKDFDYVAPREYQPPPAPFAGPAGVPAPISMSPLVLLSMGNVVETITDTSVPGVTTIYGGGGADGSSALAKLGPRDALQFSSATITGTNGNDIIYAERALLGDGTPLADTSLYAKQFLLRVAGYFTELNDIVFRGLPSYVSVTNATLQADGSWVLPSSYVISQQSFEIVYDKDAWRTDANYFDMVVEVSGEMRSQTFTSTETFRLQFMDVTESSESTNPYLTFWDDGQNKQIYILPTQDQPNTIVADAGDDIIYGGRSHDTIDAGGGNDQVWAYGGNNIVTGGSGDDQITTGDGDDTVTGGDGNDVVVTGAGINLVDTGDGTNSVTSGAGADTITGGTGSDTIDAGDGLNVVHAGAGDNIITTGSGNDTITSGSGDDIINAGDGTNNVNAGDGDNQITTGAGADTITVGAGDNTIFSGAGIDTITLGTGTNSVSAGDGNDFLYGGDGNDTLLGEDGDDVLRGGMGTNVLVGGLGTNTADYSTLGVAITASLLAGTAVGVGVSETLSQIQSITGSANDDTLLGDSDANTLSGGAGADTITGGGGNDIMYGNDGDDLITGGSGNDTVYGGAGSDTINGGGAGADVLSGGDGDDIFTNPSMNTSYDGGAGTDKVDYSSSAVNLIIDLSAGTGYTGAAQMASYTSIEWIVSGSGSDTLTGGAGNDILDGGAGTDYLRGGTGTNTLIGSGGTNYYYMGMGVDSVQASVGGWDQVEYYGSPAAVIVNLDSVVHSFVNTLGVTVNVAALTGTSRGETSSDTASWSLGDSYTAGGVDYLYTGNYNDIMWGSDIAEQFMAQGGDDYIYAAGGNDYVYLSSGNDRVDAGAGIDRFSTSWHGGNMTVYLDGYADVDANGTADYLEKGASVLSGSGYTGFAKGLSGVTLLSNFEYLIGGGGSDLLVGDANSNEINAQSGNNTVYGLGGDDLIFDHVGTNTIDGGTGTDTVSFRNEGMTGSAGYKSSTSAEIYLTDADLDGNGLMDKASTWGSFSGFTARTNLSGAYSYSSVTNVENINGTINADKLVGDANANIIRGDSGNDYISGGGGADSLYGDNGNDTFVVSSEQLATISLLSGGAGTDTLRSSGWTFSAGSIYADNTKYANIETIDVRNTMAGGTYSVNAYDIQSMVDSGNSSTLQIYLDSGDTFATQIGAGTGALSVLNTTHTATDDVYKFYSDAGHVTNNSTNLVAIINVHYGA